MVAASACGNPRRSGEPHRRLGGAGPGKYRRAAPVGDPAQHSHVVRPGSGGSGTSFPFGRARHGRHGVFRRGCRASQLVDRQEGVRVALGPRDRRTQPSRPRGPGSSISSTSWWQRSCWRSHCRRCTRCSRPGRSSAFDIEFLFFLGAIALFILLYSLFVTIPCIWTMMSSQPGVVLALGWLLYCVGVTGLEIGLFVAIAGPGGTGGRECLLLLVMNVCQCSTVFGTLRIYRALGFRFVQGRPPGRNLRARVLWR